MRLPTVGQYKTQMRELAKQFDEINKLQNKATTGKELERSSDNPLLADKIRAVSNNIQLLKGYRTNINLAEGRAAVASSVAEEIILTVNKITDTIQNAQNDTLNDSDRSNLAKDLQARLDTLLRLANTQDSQGEYLFSGMNANVPPFILAKGSWQYQGAEATSIAIGSNSLVAFNDSGQKVFGDIKTGNGVFTVSADTAHNSGTGISTSVSLLNNATFVRDNYTLSFVTNASGQLAWQVVGATGGQIIPAPPAKMPDDAPQYIAGTDMVFNGLQLQINGQPEVGDVFAVNESKSQTVFDTLQSLINTLSQSVNNEKERADLHQALGEFGSSFKQVSSHFRNYLTEVGNRGRNIDDQKTASELMIVGQNTILDRLSSAHMEEVMPELVQRMTSMELTQQTYLKIQETLQNLFTKQR